MNYMANQSYSNIKSHFSKKPLKVWSDLDIDFLLYFQSHQFQYIELHYRLCGLNI